MYPGAHDVCSDGLNADCDAGDDNCVLFAEVSLSDLDTLHYSGSSAAALGDLDGDGYDDVAIGDAANDAVYLIRGGPTGTHLGAETIEGDRDSAFGAAVLFDDFDGDGVGDLVIGAPDADGGKGTIVLRYGPDWGRETSVVPHFDEALNMGLRLRELSCSDSPSIVTTYQYSPSYEEDIYSYLVVIDSPSTTYLTTPAMSQGPYQVLDAWPVAISTNPILPAVAIGFSHTSSLYSGAGVFDCPIADEDDLDVSVRSALDGTPASLGASVIYARLASDDLLLFAGAPDANAAYGFLNLTATQIAYLDADLTWTGDGAGASAAMVADLDGDGDEELTIGGHQRLWVLRQTDDGLSDGELNTVADGMITGFSGFVVDIVAAGDVNGDGHEDMLVLDDNSVWLLYGGPEG